MNGIAMSTREKEVVLFPSELCLCQKSWPDVVETGKGK